MSLKSGHRVVPLTGEEAQKQYEDFHGYPNGTIRLQPGGWFFPTSFAELADKYYEFKFKPTDVLIMTYPKCGTTWTQEIIWTMINNPNLDNPLGEQGVNSRCPFLEFDFLLNGAPGGIVKPGNVVYDSFVKNFPDKEPKNVFLQLAELVPEPRVIKTHLPFSLLPPTVLDTCKVIYVARNPKDVAVSFCHHSRLLKLHDFKKGIPEFVDHFVNDTLVFGPYWPHLKEAWAKRDHPNLLYIFYEDVKIDPKAEITRLADFLNVKLTEKQIENVANYTSFEEMKLREDKAAQELEAVFNPEIKKDGGFLRKGITGDWKKKLSEEEIEKIDKWTKENTEDFEEDFQYKVKQI